MGYPEVSGNKVLRNVGNSTSLVGIISQKLGIVIVKIKHSTYMHSVDKLCILNV